jgi:hypothetical protein
MLWWGWFLCGSEGGIVLWVTLPGSFSHNYGFLCFTLGFSSLDLGCCSMGLLSSARYKWVCCCGGRTWGCGRGFVFLASGLIGLLRSWTRCFGVVAGDFGLSFLFGWACSVAPFPLLPWILLLLLILLLIWMWMWMWGVGLGSPACLLLFTGRDFRLFRLDALGGSVRVLSLVAFILGCVSFCCGFDLGCLVGGCFTRVGDPFYLEWSKVFFGDLFAWLSHGHVFWGQHYLVS